MRVHAAKPLPFCPGFADDFYFVGPNSFRPFGMTWGAVLRWWWGVKTWKMIVSLVADGTPFATNGTYHISRSDVFNESNILCTLKAFILNTDPTEPIVTVSIFGEPLAPVDGPWWQHGVKQQGGLYYPTVIVETVDGFFSWNKGDGSLPFASTPVGTLTIDGFACDLVKDNTNPLTLSGSIDITIEEFWPYADSNGLNPIYDSVTGAQLLNPITTDGY